MAMATPVQERIPRDQSNPEGQVYELLQSLQPFFHLALLRFQSLRTSLALPLAFNFIASGECAANAILAI
jgi:hypothetical protein